MDFYDILKSSWRVNEACTSQPRWQYPPEQISQTAIKHLQRQNLKDKAFTWHFCRESGVGFKILKYSVTMQRICFPSTAWQLLSWALSELCQKFPESGSEALLTLWEKFAVGKVFLGLLMSTLTNIILLMLSTKLTTGKKNHRVCTQNCEICTLSQAVTGPRVLPMQKWKYEQLPKRTSQLVL